MEKLFFVSHPAASSYRCSGDRQGTHVHNLLFLYDHHVLYNFRTCCFLSDSHGDRASGPKGPRSPVPWHSSVFMGLIVLYTPLGYLYYIPPLGICQVVFIKSFVDKLVSYFYFSYSQQLGHRMAEHPSFP